MYKYIYPLDPECPKVKEWHEAFAEDELMVDAGMTAEFYAEFTANHLHTCERCQEHGAANVEVGV